MQDPFEVAIHLTGNEQNWEEAIESKYGIDYDTFSQIVDDLLPLCMVAESPLTKTVFQGFAFDGVFLMKKEIDNE